jgi:DNA replicative helicase MCM subunit Mcm2 (Cdc46/Mcm family)
MVIGSTIFDHKDIHKMTCECPDGNTFNQIARLIIDTKHLSNLKDVRTYRGANVDSYHYLVISNIRSRISNARKAYDPVLGSLIVKEVEARYVEMIYESLTQSIDSESVDGAWKALKEIIKMSADITLGKIGRLDHNYWFEAECNHVTMIKNKAY